MAEPADESRPQKPLSRTRYNPADEGPIELSSGDEAPEAPEPVAKAPARPLPRTRYSPSPDPPTPIELGSTSESESPRDAEPAPARARPSARGGEGPARGKSDRKSPSQGGRPDSKPDRDKVLKVETPEFDTYETRSRVRMFIGLVAGTILVFAVGSVLMRAFRSNEQPYVEDDLDGVIDEGPLPGAPKPASTPTRLEQEARIALGDARRFAEKGDGPTALKRLHAVIESYPQSSAAKDAQEALDRARKGLPLFLDVPLVVAEAIEKTESPPPAPEPVVVAEPAPPAPPPGPSRVELTPPSTPPEPRRDTGLALERADIEPRALPQGFRPRTEGGVHPSGWPLEITCDTDGSSLVFVPGGTFLMGRNDAEATERPAHRVTLSPFYIDQHEVTVRQFARWAESRSPGGSSMSPSESEASLPRSNVRLADAVEFAKWSGRTLPTEAQWEFAARTIDGRLRPWGNAAPSWSRPRKPGQIDPVMSFDLDLSPYGAFDLAGNVREWTSDFFRYYDPALANSVSVDPRVLDSGRSKTPTRVIKGGADDWAVSWRRDMRPEAALPDLGFRCVLNLPGASPPPPSAPAATPGQPAPPDASTPTATRAPAGVVPF